MHDYPVLDLIEISEWLCWIGYCPDVAFRCVESHSPLQVPVWQVCLLETETGRLWIVWSYGRGDRRQSYISRCLGLNQMDGSWWSTEMIWVVRGDKMVPWGTPERTSALPDTSPSTGPSAFFHQEMLVSTEVCFHQCQGALTCPRVSHGGRCRTCLRSWGQSRLFRLSRNHI